LIDILNKEKENTNMNTINNNNITNNISNNMELDLNKETKDELALSQKAELGSSVKKNNFSQEEFIHLSSGEKEKDKEKEIEKKLDQKDKIENEVSLSTNTQIKSSNFISFMYPVFKSNIVKGSVDKNTVQEIKINFPGDITEFVQGGAYCNYENGLYFTGGQEYIKDAGKLFLMIGRNDKGQNAIKLPDMKYPHWNHSMIADKGKIYVIGGYASNKCEVYDLSSNTWTEIPDLIEKERQRSMLYVDNNFLYCFMGRSQTDFLSTVERLNLDNVNAGWESIIVDNCGDINLKFYGAGIIRMNQTNKIFKL